MRKVNLKTLRLKSYDKTLLQKVSALKTPCLLCFMVGFGRVESITGETGFGNNEIALQMKSDTKSKNIISMNKNASKETYSNNQYGVQDLSKSDIKSQPNQSLGVMQSETQLSNEKSSDLEKSGSGIEKPAHLLGYEDGSYDGQYEDDHLYVF